MKKSYLIFLSLILLSGFLKSQSVGQTSGSLTVSLTGGINYSVPIKNLPGIKDITPSVSLEYSSQSGNGIAGWGWNVSGSSSITRVGSTKFHDGNIDAVDYDTEDRFALDGQRLILKSGVYGQDNAEYQTENYSNLKIISQGTTPDGPLYFTVYYPDGNVARYGSDNDSKNSFEWKVTQIDDVKNNRIEFIYVKEGSHNIYLTTIRYGGNPNIGEYNPVNNINFYYKNSSRTDQTYIYDSKSVYSSKKLDRIEVLGNGQLFRKYQLTYNTTSLNYERLVQVQEFNNAGQSIKPIVFEYDTTANGLADNSRTVTAVTPGYDNTSWNYVSGYFDKDGALDFMTYPNTKDKLYRFDSEHMLAYNSNIYGDIVGLAKFSDVFSTKIVLPNGKFYNLDAVTTISDGVLQASEPEEIITISNFISNSSFNSLDLAFSNSYTFPKAENYACYSDNVNYAKISKKFISGDFDGDGISDVIAVSFPFYNHYASSNCGNGPVIDIGDGSNPCCIQNQYNNFSNFYLLKSDASITNNQQPEYIGQNSVITTSSKIYVTDFNGDGKSDLYVINHNNIYVYSIENGLMQLKYQNYDNLIKAENPVYVTDLNGDGKTDLITPLDNASANWRIYMSNGKDFTASVPNIGVTYYKPQVINSCYPNGSGGQLCGYMLQAYYYTFSDINGDGKADIIVHDVLTPHNYPQGGQWNYPYTQFGDNYTIRDKGSVKYNMGSSALGFPNFSAYIDNWQNNFTYGGATNKGTPIFLNNPGSVNQNLDYAFFGGDKIKYVSFKKDNRTDVTLKRVKENDVITTINYSPMVDNTNGTYIGDDSEVYPYVNVNISPSTQLVSKITREFNGESKIQEYKYKGAVTNLEGIGFLGFKGVATSSVYGGTISQPLWTILKQDPQKRGANIESYLLQGNVDFNSPSGFITKNLKSYNTSLLPNKVFVNLPTVIQQIDNLTGVTKFLYYEEYDAFNNVLKSRDVAPGGEKIIQNELDNNPAGISQQYFVGRLLKKTTTKILGTDTFVTEKKFSYNNNLLSQLMNKGNGTDYITEDYEYDGYGNILQKTVSAPNMPSKVEKMKYDETGRFVIKLTNIFGFEDTYNYDATFGMLNSKKNYLNQTISYFYDGWQKKITETDIYNNATNFYYDWITSGDYPNGIRLKVIEGTGAINETHSDVWGRKRLERKLSINNKWIDKKTDYDIQDKVYRVSDQYFSTTTPSRWTINEFDQYNRIKKITFPTGKLITTTYNGLNVTVNDGQKNQTITSDSWGNKIKMIDDGGEINYSYYANGSLKTTNYAGHTISVEQDGWGRKTKMSDPTLGGDYTYDYDIYGQILLEENPKGKTDYVYDQYGRVLSKRIFGDATDIKINYNYNTLGFLESEIGISNGISNSYVYTYDNYYRVSEKEENNGLAKFNKNFSYDSFGRLKEEYTLSVFNSLSSGFKFKNIYASCGALESIVNEDDKVIWKLEDVNEKEQIVYARLGNGVNINNEYDGDYYLHSIKHSNSSVGDIVQNIYNFDPILGVLLNRNSTVIQGGWNENFEYDNLQRLTAWSDPNGTQSQTYDNFGRIQNSSTVGDYKYDGSSRYKKETINLNSVGDAYYKQNKLQVIEYNAYRMPVSIKQDEIEKAAFNYNMHQKRSYSKYDHNKETDQYSKNKIYSDDGSVEIIRYYDNNILTSRFITYIGGDAYAAPAVYIKDFHNEDLVKDGVHYLHRDYQGTILAISDHDAKVEERRHFDPWGNLVYLEKNGNDVDLNKYSPELLLERGYTGHEHFFQVGLIHMNGRLYDPKLHTFLSTDNFIQDPFNTQNYNRYGYVLNNPLMYTDPSGDIAFIPILIGMAYGAMAGAAIAVVTYSIPAILNGSWHIKSFGTSVLYGAISGAISGGISGATGSLVGSFWQSGTMDMMTGVISQVGTSLAMGDQVTWGMVAAGAVTGYIGGKMKNDSWTGIKGGWVANASGELLYNSGRGAILGGVGGTVAAIIDGKDVGDGIKNGMINGAFGSASQTFAMIATFGATYKPTSEQLEYVKKMSAFHKVPYENVKWRSGGLYQLLQPLWSGGKGREVVWGNNVATFGNQGVDTTTETFGHEFGHIIQGYRQGWANFQAKGIYEQIVIGQDSYDQYLCPTCNEANADILLNSIPSN